MYVSFTGSARKRLRRSDRVADEVHLGAAAEAAAEIRAVHRDLRRGDAGDVGGDVAGDALRLCRHPNGHAAGLDERRAVHRLHAEVGEPRQLVHRLDRWTGRGCKRGARIAVLAEHGWIGIVERLRATPP